MVSPLSLLFLVAAVAVAPRAVSPQCRRAPRAACAAAPPAPGVAVLGRGLDVTSLQPAGGRVLDLGDTGDTPGDTGDTPGDTGDNGATGGCLLCPDALRSGRPRRVPAGVGGWHSGRRCRRGSGVAAGAAAVGTAVAEAATRGWRLELRAGRGEGTAGVTLVAAGSRSRVAQEGLRWQRQDRSALSWLQVACAFYWTWLDPSSVRPSPHFVRAVRSLPPKFGPATAAEYAELLAAFGTHAVRGARLGGRVRAVTALRLCRAAMAGLGALEAADCLRAEAAFGGAGAAAAACRTARRATEANVSLSEFFAERLLDVDGGGAEPDGDLAFGRPEGFSRWLRGVPGAPAMLEADLWPLHALVPRSDPRRRALRAAIGSYVAAKALRVNCSCARLAAGGPRSDGQGADRSADRLDDLSDDQPSDRSSADRSSGRWPSPGRHPCHCACSSGVTSVSLSGSPCCPSHRGAARVSVLVLSGHGWSGDLLSPPDAYVWVSFGDRRARTATAWNARRPRWAERLELGEVRLLPGARLELAVWDEDHGWDDDRLGACREPLSAGVRRLACFPGGGRLDFAVAVACGPSLAGPLCHDYEPAAPEGGVGVREGTAWPPRGSDWDRVLAEFGGDEEEDEDEELGTAPLHRFWELPEGSEVARGENPNGDTKNPKSQSSGGPRPQNRPQNRSQFGDEDEEDEEDEGPKNPNSEGPNDDPKTPKFGPFWDTSEDPKNPKSDPNLGSPQPQKRLQNRPQFGDEDEDEENPKTPKFGPFRDTSKGPKNDPKNPDSDPNSGSPGPPNRPQFGPVWSQFADADEEDEDDEDEELSDAEFWRLWGLSDADPKIPDLDPNLGSPGPPERPQFGPVWPQFGPVWPRFGEEEEEDKGS